MNRPRVGSRPAVPYIRDESGVSRSRTVSIRFSAPARSTPKRIEAASRPRTRQCLVRDLPGGVVQFEARTRFSRLFDRVVVVPSDEGELPTYIKPGDGRGNALEDAYEAVLRDAEVAASRAYKGERPSWDANPRSHDISSALPRRLAVRPTRPCPSGRGAIRPRASARAPSRTGPGTPCVPRKASISLAGLGADRLQHGAALADEDAPSGCRARRGSWPRCAPAARSSLKDSITTPVV